MEILFDLLILLLLFACSGFFSSTETALFSLTPIERRRMSENHPKFAKWVTYHLENPRRTLVTILVGNLLANTLVASMATLMALKYFDLQGMGFVMILFTLALILFCEVIPKVLAVRNNEGFAMVSAAPLHLFALIIFPIRRVARLLADWILSFLIREKKEHPDMISEEELKTLAKIGEEEGVLDRQERQMIHKLFELGERPVKAIMTPRTDLIALDIQDSSEKNLGLMKQYHYSQLPVYQDTTDKILGILPVEEYLLDLQKGMKSLLRQPLYVPETKRIDDLLEEFRRKNESFAVCVDEFGGTAGIVTQEDILEEIFGEYYDEYAKVENPIRPFGFREYIVEAKIPLDDFNEFFDVELKAQEATSLGGYILETLGEVPEKGKQFTSDKLEFRINDVVRHRIHNVVVKKKS